LAGVKNSAVAVTAPANVDSLSRRECEAARGHPDLGAYEHVCSEARVSRRPALAKVSRYGSAWLLVVAGGVLAVACVSIASTAPAAVRPWAAVAAGFSLTVLGIILVAIRRAERQDDSEDAQ